MQPLNVIFFYFSFLIWKYINDTFLSEACKKPYYSLEVLSQGHLELKQSLSIIILLFK